MYTYELKQYSKGRMTAMGVAAMLITWFHSHIVTQPGSFLYFLKNTGDIGVDMFMLASGVGMYFAVKKHRSYFSFLGSRLIRILPAYLLISIPWYVYRDLHLGYGGYWEYFLDVTTLRFWLKGDLYCWFVPSILALYLVTPMYVRLVKKHTWMTPVCMVSVFLFCIVVRKTALLSIVGYLLLLISRIPTYLFGIYLGSAIDEGRSFRIPVPAVLLGAVGLLTGAAYVCRMSVFDYILNYKFIVYPPMAVALSLLCAKIPANSLTDYFGKRSLEVYLVFEKAQEFLVNQRFMWPLLGKTQILFTVIALALTLVVTEVLKFLSEVLTGRKNFWRSLTSVSGQSKM